MSELWLAALGVGALGAAALAIAHRVLTRELDRLEASLVRVRSRGTRRSS